MIVGGDVGRSAIYHGLALSVILAGCGQREFKPLNNVTLTCNVDEDCPEAYFCETRLEPPECKLIEQRDLDLPETTQSALSVSEARVGTPSVATFTTDKAMVQAELKVYLGDDPDVNQFTENAENTDPNNNTFEFVYEITGEEGEGTKAIKAF